MKDHWKKWLQGHWVKWCDTLRPPDILPYLKQEGCISKGTAEEIDKYYENKGHRFAADKLMDAIYRFSNHGIVTFLKALHKLNGYEGLLKDVYVNIPDDLRQEIEKELMPGSEGAQNADGACAKPKSLARVEPIIVKCRQANIQSGNYNVLNVKTEESSIDINADILDDDYDVDANADTGYRVSNNLDSDNGHNDDIDIDDAESDTNNEHVGSHVIGNIADQKLDHQSEGADNDNVKLRSTSSSDHLVRGGAAGSQDPNISPNLNKENIVEKSSLVTAAEKTLVNVQDKLVQRPESSDHKVSNAQRPQQVSGNNKDASAGDPGNHFKGDTVPKSPGVKLQQNLNRSHHDLSKGPSELRCPDTYDDNDDGAHPAQLRNNPTVANNDPSLTHGTNIEVMRPAFLSDFSAASMNDKSVSVTDRPVPDNDRSILESENSVNSSVGPLIPATVPDAVSLVSGSDLGSDLYNAASNLPETELQVGSSLRSTASGSAAVQSVSGHGNLPDSVTEDNQSFHLQYRAPGEGADNLAVQSESFEKPPKSQKETTKIDAKADLGSMINFQYGLICACIAVSLIGIFIYRRK